MAEQPLLVPSTNLLITPANGVTATSATPPTVSCCHPSTRLFRSLILFLACTLTFGSYFSYDNPGALTEAFKHRLCQNSTTKYEWMYSIYSWPNTIQPFIGGYIIDNVLGVRRAAIIFCALIALGTAIVALSATLTFPHDSVYPFYIAIFGRFVFGLGGESLTVTQNTFVARWFSGAEVSFITTAAMGTILDMYLYSRFNFFSYLLKNISFLFLLYRLPLSLNSWLLRLQFVYLLVVLVQL